MKTDLLKTKLDEDLRTKSFTLAGWQLPGALIDRFSFGGNELKLLSEMRTDKPTLSANPQLDHLPQNK